MMKRNIPGGKVDTVYSRTNDGKEVVATHLVDTPAEEEPTAEPVENGEAAEETPEEES